MHCAAAEEAAGTCFTGAAPFALPGGFFPEEVCAVKAQLGPWPRALEEAGLKPRKFDPEQQALLKKEKRIAAKRKRNAARNLKVPKVSAPDRDACGEPLADI